MFSSKSVQQALVTTKLGQVQGSVDEANDGTNYYSFHGIPYAEPPIGELRFKAPRPPKPWIGIRDGTVEGDECFSKHQVMLTPVGSEDCLTLNVFTRSLQSNAKLPVMVWIHGGGFTSGSSKTEAYGPQFFMCENIVLLTINYRIGIFGFLAIQDKSLGVPGNAGLKDQVMALHWVKDNIAAFGGDANNVTVFGESAGAAAINYLLCSPMACGLFHKVIMQSGSALNPWARGQFLPGELAGFFKVDGKSEKDVLNALMCASKEDLLTAQYSCRDRNLVSEQRPFSPVVEDFNPYEPSFLLEDPLQVMLSGNYIKVPMITGYNTHEGMLHDIIELKAKVSLMITNFDQAVPYPYGLTKGSAGLKKIGDDIRKFYYGDCNPAHSSSRPQFRTMQTDNFFLRGIYKTMRTILMTNPHPIYLYRFAFDGELNIYKHMANIKEAGVCHGDDVFYMFRTLITPPITPESDEGKTVRRFVKFWTNFARTSNPNGRCRDRLLNVEWPRTDGLTMLEIDRNLRVIEIPEKERMNFWDKIDVVTKNKL